MEKYFEANRKMWNEYAELHYKSKHYNVDQFKKGTLSLLPIEREELGDVAGKSLLHLMCHFGMDTLSWAKLGATVTGVDFSEKAIEFARMLSAELGIAGTFIHANLYELPQVLSGTFDIVFTSYGVLCWLPDLKKWAKIIAQYLKPGGTFYIVEGHPFAWMFQNEGEVRELEVAYSYFEQRTPLEFEVQGSYADKTAKIKQKVEYEWPHSVSEILTSLIDAGLNIQSFHEFPFSAFEMYPFMEQRKDGWWWLKDQKVVIPLMFSLKAIKE